MIGKKIRLVYGKKQFLFYSMMIVFLMCFSAGCSSKEEKVEEIVTEVSAEPEKQETNVEIKVPELTEEPVETHEGEVRSYLTGLWIPEEYAAKRPYAIMMNNLKKAYPQAGLGEAAIVYEALAEGGITRLMGIFDFVSGERIGSVRSARHYFVLLASEYDSIFVHFGQTKYAQKMMDRLGTDNLNGLLGEGNIVFFRDDTIAAPHNAFASGTGILQGTEKKAYRTERADTATSHFRISEEAEVVLSGENCIPANEMILPFSNYGTSRLVYHPEQKVYHRFAYDTEHIDPVSGEPLEFTTILVQFVEESDIDDKGYQTMKLEDSKGTGYYMTGGKAVPIYWSRGANDSATQYTYDESGQQEIILNPGRIYIAVYPTYRQEKLTITE